MLLENLRNSVGTKPFSDGNALSDAHLSDLLDRIGRELLIAEVAENLDVEWVALALTRPLELAAERDTHECLSEQHLTAADHAAPALVALRAVAVD